MSIYTGVIVAGAFQQIDYSPGTQNIDCRIEKYGLQQAVLKLASNLYTKGQKETIKAHAEARGESLNAFINRAIRRPWSGMGPPQRTRDRKKEIEWRRK